MDSIRVNWFQYLSNGIWRPSHNSIIHPTLLLQLNVLQSLSIHSLDHLFSNTRCSFTKTHLFQTVSTCAYTSHFNICHYSAGCICARSHSFLVIINLISGRSFESSRITTHSSDSPSSASVAVVKQREYLEQLWQYIAPASCCATPEAPQMWHRPTRRHRVPKVRLVSSRIFRLSQST